MSHTIRTARGELVDFDAIKIKQELAQSPMNIEVARRKAFIDSKEGKARGFKSDLVEPVADEIIKQTIVEIPPSTKKK